MSAIVFNRLNTSRKSIKPNRSELYTDVALDMSIDPNSLNDIIASYDIQAISNSVSNILSTRLGDNFLVPDFGARFDKYLFEIISKANGQELGREIETALTKYEPRIQVSNITVQVQTDLQQYTVYISVFVPSLGQTLSFNPIFTKDGTYYLTNNNE